MPELNQCLNDKDNVLWDTLAEWHAKLQDSRGDRAMLRRAKTPEDVLFAPAYHRGLVNLLRKADIGLSQQSIERLALPAGILANAKTLVPGPHVARMLAQAERLEERMRDARFRRLLLIEDRDRLYTACLRLVRYLDGIVEPRSLVIGTFYWNTRAKRDWARNYYLGGREEIAADA